MIHVHARHAVLCIALFSLPLTALVSRAVRANASTDDEADAKAAIEALHDAFEAGDIKAIESATAPDWSIFMTMPQWQGVTDKQSWLPDFARMNEAGSHVRFEPISKHVGVGDKVAWYRADEAVSWVDDNGAVMMRAHWLTTGVFEKRDGKWVAVHVHHSFVDDAPEESADTEGQN